METLVQFGAVQSGDPIRHLGAGFPHQERGCWAQPTETIFCTPSSEVTDSNTKVAMLFGTLSHQLHSRGGLNTETVYLYWIYMDFH